MLRFAVILLGIGCVTLLVAFSSFDDALPPLPDDPQNRGVFTFAVTNDPGSLDPGRTSASIDFRVVKCLYEPLLINQWGGGGLEPGAAAGFPDVSDDGLTYTFTIRKDAKWSDGHPVTAEDFVYGWRRAMLPDTASDYASLFYVIQGVEEFFYWRMALMDFSALEEVIDDEAMRAEFLERYPDLKRQSQTFSHQKKWDLTLREFDKRVGIEAVGEHTFRVTLAAPTAFFPELCAFPTFSPMPAHILEPLADVDEAGWYVEDAYFGDADRLVTNGPYVLQRWKRKVRMVFDQNPHYWNRDAMGNLRIVQETIRDQSLQLQRFEQGQLDWIPDVGELKLKLTEIDYEHAHTVPSAGTYYYQFNCREKLPSGVDNPMANARVRRALAMCINRRQIVENVTRMYEPVAELIVPDQEIPGYTGPIASAVRYDPDAAAALLAEAGYPGGAGFPPIKILINNDSGPGHSLVALAVKKNWEDQLGLTVTLEQTEFKVLLERSKKGNFHVRRAGWFGDYIDPTTWLDMHRVNDSNNDAKYNNPAYDALLEQAAGELDKAKRFDLLAQAEAMLLQDAPISPIYYYATVMVYDKEKIDLRPNAWNNLRLEMIPVTREAGE